MNSYVGNQWIVWTGRLDQGNHVVLVEDENEKSIPEVDFNHFEGIWRENGREMVKTREINN